MCRITYESNFFKSINDSQLKPSANLQASLNELIRYKKRSKRGCRAGRFKQRKIHVISSPHDFQSTHYAAARGVNFNNLIKVKSTRCPSPANNLDYNDSPMTPHGHDIGQSVESSSTGQLPTFFMTNAQSLGNKFEYIEVVFEQNGVNVGVVTEPWFSNNMPENQLAINS